MSSRARFVALLGFFGLLCTGTVGAAAPSVPRAIVLSADRLTVVTVMKSYVAWRINLPTAGHVKVTLLGAQTGSGAMMLDDEGGAGGGASLTNVGTDGIGVHEDPHPDAGLGSTFLGSGVHLLVVIIGSGTVPAGVEVIRVKAPRGTTVLNVTSGPAFDLAESNFASGGDTVVRTPLVAAASVHGSVRKRIAHRLFGYFWGFPPTTKASFVDPSGTNQIVGPTGWWWNDAPPGSYTLHIDEELSPTVNPYPGMQALFADVRLP